MGTGDRWCHDCGSWWRPGCSDHPRSSDEPEHAGVLDTTGSNASTGSDETGRDDTVPRPHYHDDQRPEHNVYFNYDLINDDTYNPAIVHIIVHHFDHDFSRADFEQHIRRAINEYFDHDDAKPVRDARAHIERTQS